MLKVATVTEATAHFIGTDVLWMSRE